MSGTNRKKAARRIARERGITYMQALQIVLENEAPTSPLTPAASPPPAPVYTVPCIHCDAPIYPTGPRWTHQQIGGASGGHWCNPAHTRGNKQTKAAPPDGTGYRSATGAPLFDDPVTVTAVYDHATATVTVPFPNFDLTVNGWEDGLGIDDTFDQTVVDALIDNGLNPDANDFVIDGETLEEGLRALVFDAVLNAGRRHPEWTATATELICMRHMPTDVYEYVDTITAFTIRWDWCAACEAQSPIDPVDDDSCLVCGSSTTAPDVDGDTPCRECGRPAFLESDGISHHRGPSHGGIDYGLDADHVALPETPDDTPPLPDLNPDDYPGTPGTPSTLKAFTARAAAAGTLMSTWLPKGRRTATLTAVRTVVRTETDTDSGALTLHLTDPTGGSEPLEWALSYDEDPDKAGRHLVHDDGLGVSLGDSSGDPPSSVYRLVGVPATHVGYCPGCDMDTIANPAGPDLDTAVSSNPALCARCGGPMMTRSHHGWSDAHDRAAIWPDATPDYLGGYTAAQEVIDDAEPGHPVSGDGVWAISADGMVRVEWVNLGEGLSGDHDPDDPDDVNLLRYDTWIRLTPRTRTLMNLEPDDDDMWGIPQDGSYCTNMPADTPLEDLRLAAAAMAERLADEIGSGGWKRTAEELSWIGPNDIPRT